MFSKKLSKTKFHNVPADELKIKLDSGASFEDIDEMFYPGERAAYIRRKSQYPIPEGTGRRNPSSDDMFWVKEIKYDQYTIGLRERTLLYIGDVYIGYIDEIRREMFDIYWKTNDGEEFAHWGGSEGAEWHLINKYWIYGNPPEKKYKSKYPTFSEFIKLVENGKIKIDVEYYKVNIEWEYKTKYTWLNPTEDKLQNEALKRSYYAYTNGNYEKLKCENCGLVGKLINFIKD